MTVAAKLRTVFIVHIALLAVVLVFHVRANRRAAESGRALSAISARQQSAFAQTERVAEMNRTADKYAVTGDVRYRERLSQLAAAYDEELRRLRIAGGPLSSSVASDIGGRLRERLDESGVAMQTLAETSQQAMMRELDRSDRAARAAERVSWLLAIVVLAFGAVLSAILVRSIVAPLERLARGTREVAKGRFAYRLDARGADEFAQVARAFDAMARRLGELDGMKRDFVSNVSHDLKTPLSSMQETTNALLDGLAGPLSERQKRLLLLNRESGRRLSSMLAKLLDLSRLESQPAPKFAVVDVVGVVGSAVERANAARSEGGAAPGLVLLEPVERLFVRGDEDALGQLLDNLIENALKFSPCNGTVRVSVSEGDSAVTLCVADEGPGVPDAEKERIFERFHQTAAGRAARSRGVGLGLSICRHIAAAHGGSIRVIDNADRGVVFQVTLPRLEFGVPEAAVADSATLAGAAA